MITTTNINTSPGDGSGGSIVVPNNPLVELCPPQIIGFVPMKSCSFTECRTWHDCEYINPVFAEQGGTDAYKNDSNSFLFDIPLAEPRVGTFDDGVDYDGDGLTGTPNDLIAFLAQQTGTTSSYTFCLQKCTNNAWNQLATLNTDLHGKFFAQGFTSQHPTYTGYRIDWARVYELYGEGIYRFCLNSTIYGSDCCQVSEPFCLKVWDCDSAHGTVKFEAYMSYKIGSIDDDLKMFDLCGFTWYDSIRMKGYFGDESTEYEETNIEYENGTIVKVRDEALQKYKLKSKRMPKYIHDRFKVYGLMADSVLVSDYNRNNPDYNINRKRVIKAGGYAPVPHTKTRLWSVEVDFREGIQKVEKSICCPAADPIAGLG